MHTEPGKVRSEVVRARLLITVVAIGAPAALSFRHGWPVRLQIESGGRAQIYRSDASCSR